jgi:hypothetical protein
MILFLFNTVKAQTINWTTGNEAAVSQYLIESTQSDTVAGWKTFATIAPGKSSYSYAIPDQQLYWRLHATGKQNFYTKALLYIVGVNTQNSVTISSQKVATSWWSDKLTWTTTKEINVSYYLIEYSSGTAWKSFPNIIDKGNSSYSYSNNRGWFSKKPSYRITPYFKNGSTGTILYF